MVFVVDRVVCNWDVGGCEVDIGGFEVAEMDKARCSNLWGIGVIAAFLCCLCLGQSAGAAQQAGRIVGWGRNYEGQCDIPSPNSGFIAVAGGRQHSLGLKVDGSIVAWGNNEEGQCDIPSPNADFIAVAGGEYHSLGLKEDGSIVAWGIDDGSNWDYGQVTDTPDGDGFIAVAAGRYHSLGLKQDGSIVAWGYNRYGQCDIPSPNADFIAVAGGYGHSLGLKEDGSVVAWGRNSDGECEIPSPNTDFIAVAGGGTYSLGLKEDGSIVAWGRNYEGQCDIPSPNTDFIAVAGGYGHSLGLKEDGSIVAWGYNLWDQCNIPSPNTNFIAVAAGGFHSLALKKETGLPLSGSGTEGDPWRIQSLADFDEFAAWGNYWDDYTRLETDVNLAGRVYERAVIAPDEDNSNYGFDGTAFTGVFDGNDHKIMNLTIDNGGGGNRYLGLIGYNGGELKNLGLEDCSVLGRVYVGGMAGMNSYSISNCHFYGDVSGFQSVGGLVGQNNWGYISNCHFYGDVSGTGDKIGGLVGENGDSMHRIIWNCWFVGDVSGNRYVGGLVGYNYMAAISDCYSIGDVSGSGAVGGLAGYHDEARISNCYSHCDVNGYWNVGGLVGHLHRYSQLYDCYSTGDVNGDHDVGGLVGQSYDSTVSRCYSTGYVRGNSRVGGLVGYNNGGGLGGAKNDSVSSFGCLGGEITDSYWDIQTSGKLNMCGYQNPHNSCGCDPNYGKTTAEMHQQSTFTDWDFDNVWNICENQDYPYLRSLSLAPQLVCPADCPSADLTGDCFVDFDDYALFAENWGRTCPEADDLCEAADIDRNGWVNIVDLCGFAENWLGTGRVIRHGEVAVDGVIGDDEWTDIDWIPLDYTIYGSPNDVSEAVFALQWNEATNKVYVVVKVDDGDHVFQEGWVEWDASDIIEVFSQGSATGGEGWQGRGDVGTYDTAQQYAVAPKLGGGAWASWGYGQEIEPDADLEYAVTVDGRQIIYEIGLTMFEHYGARTDPLGGTIVTDLRMGKVVGFDLFVDTRYSDGFGALAENSMALKYRNADHFAKYVLVESSPDMVLIPGGTFEMGDSFGEGYSDELPVHTVTLDSFYMGKYEITNGQYCEYLNSAMSQGLITVTSGVVYQAGSDYAYCDTESSSGFSQIDYNDVAETFSARRQSCRDMSNDPMVMVSWYGAAAYCNWRSQQERYHTLYDPCDPNWPCDFSKKGYRLATEAEWEYAARGGLSGSRFPWGDTISHSQANYYSSSLYSCDISPTTGYHPTWNDGLYPYTSPVGSFAANGYGLYDTAGNVCEWCNDWIDLDYYDYSPTDNPTGPTSGAYRVLRGGGWLSSAYDCRAARRISSYPGDRNYYGGFRIVLDLPADPCVLDDIVWVDINDPGVSGHEGFNGEMSKYETTNFQYCEFLNAALASGDIYVSGDIVYGSNGSNSGADFVGKIYFDTFAADDHSQITYSGGSFSVRTRDDYDMSNHPVVDVSWYGAMAFCNYYGYRLPTEWEWQAVADYDGSYTYGCGTTIDYSKANYDLDNPLYLSSHPYTTPVDHYSSYGYGVNDMAGNAGEWTDSWYSDGSDYRVLRSGAWNRDDDECTVSDRPCNLPHVTDKRYGFRVCR